MPAPARLPCAFPRRHLHPWPQPPTRASLLFPLLAVPLLRSATSPVATPEFCAPGIALTAPVPPAFRQPESNRHMALRIQEIATKGPPFDSPYRFPETARFLQSALARTTDRAEILKLSLPCANALLRAGDPQEALREFERYEKLMKEDNPILPSPVFVALQTSKALCYLRLGEQENCLLGHSADSCLLPIRGGGIHQLPRGSRGAIRMLTPLLERFPGDLRARWLLNIAYMTLGQYPAEVPPQWLIDPKVFESDYDIHRFPDVAGNVGLAVDDLAGGVIMDDFDNDGFLDLMTSAWHPDSQLRFFRNNGNGTFTDRTAAAGLTGETGSLNIIQADYDNDGFVDVLMLRGGWLGPLGRYPNSLLHNNGDGTFTDVTEAAGLLSFHPTQTAVWFDYNGDGRLDLFIGNESDPVESHPCELYRNHGNGTFTECAAENGVAVVGFVKGVVSADYNHDGRPDLYLSRRDGANVLLRNDGPAGTDANAGAKWKFTDVARDAGVTEPFRSFSCAFFDYDNDGWPDLLVTGYAIQDSGDVAADYLGLPTAGEHARLYRNRGDGTFADVSRECGLDRILHTMGCNFGDLDNDGWLDYYAGTGDPGFATLIPSRMFRNDGGRRFQDVTTSGGFGQLQKGHGIAFGDIDNDGDEDIYSVVGGAVNADHYHNQLFANPGHGNHWLKLKLEGVRSNRSALGARLKLVVRTAAGAERAIHRTVGSGGSFGASPLRQEIGLGDATAIVCAEIFWPTTGATQVLPNLALDHFYQVREDAPAPIAVTVSRFQLPLSDDAPHPPMPAQLQSPASGPRVALNLAPPKKT